jgi:ABC-type amino acid transport substrate-binding protein
MNKRLNPLFAFTLTALISFTMLSCNGSGKKENDDEGSTPSPSTEMTLKERILSAGELVVGVEPDAPPIYFEDGDIKQGFDYELIKHISKQVFDNLTISTRETGYDDLPGLLAEDKIDIMAGGRTDDDRNGELYSEPYLSYGYCIVTKTTNSKKYTDLNSIKNARIGVYDDYAATWVKQNAKGATISILGDREDENTPESDWMKGLLNNEVDVIIYDYPFASNEVVDYKGVTITSKNLNENEPNEYVLVLNSKIPGADELMEEINKAIQSFKESPDYSDAVAKYIPNTGGTTTAPDLDLNNAYIVQKGETLSIIAKNHLGDPMRYQEIYELNKKWLASADIIYPGQALVKPAGWK